MQKTARCGRQAYGHRSRSAKTLMLMKLTAILLVTFLLNVAAVTAQKITFSGRNVPLTTIFSEVKKQTGYVCIYSDPVLARAKPVTVAAQDEPLVSFLDKVFRNQPLTYRITDKNIAIAVAANHTSDMLSATEKKETDIVLTGKVMDSSGRPLEGASVEIKTLKLGTATNAQGGFRLTGVAEGSQILSISYVGYERQFKKINVEQENPEIFVVLATSTKAVDEIQVIAYGKASKRFQTGSVATIKSEVLERQPVMNVLQALQGQVPGVVVNTTSGAPGSRTTIQVRGQNSINAGINGVTNADQPLIIVDGVPLAAQNKNLYALSGFGGTILSSRPGTTGMSPLDNLNPADIESISFLKDADATSIYGSKGLNGVMLITTKKGKAGKTKLNLNVYTAPTKATRVVKMLNTDQYMMLRKEAMVNDGITSLPATAANIRNYPDQLIFDPTKYTNFADKYYGGTANNTTVNASLSGGTGSTTFIVSTGYARETYNFPGDFKDERLTLHTGFRHAPASSKLSIDFGTDFSYSKNNTASSPNLGKALTLPPNLPEMVNPDGSLVWNYKGLDFGNLQMNAFLQQPFFTKNLSINSNMQLAYQIMHGLRVSVNTGYSFFLADQYGGYPRSTLNPATNRPSSADFSKNKLQAINIEPQINYDRTIGNGRLSLLAGGTYRREATDNDNLNASNYSNDAFLGTPAGAATLRIQTVNELYKYVAVFGRVNYVHDDKYILNLTGRRDGSSNFGPGRQFGNFGSAGMGWIFSEENFFRKKVPFVSFGKLSANYGTVGSDNIPPYGFQDYWALSEFTPIKGMIPYLPQNLFNPQYSWGVKKSWNASLDIGFFDGRLNVNTTWYRGRTSNQLTQTPLATQTGFTSVIQNQDAVVENKGWEFLISSENIKNKPFTWRTNFNVSFNRNTLVAYKDLSYSSYKTSYLIGKSTSTLLLFNYKGVNEETGLFEFYKADGKTPTYAPTGPGSNSLNDRSAYVDLQPKFTGGLTNTFNYKGFELTCHLQFAKQTDRNYLYSIYNISNLGNPYYMNLPVEALHRWQKSGDETDVQKLTTKAGTAAATGQANFVNSTGAYGDASYIRLKNVSLAYTMPEKWMKKVSITDCRVFVNAQNLLTITGYKVGDPEMPGVLYGIPPQRTIAAGLSFTF